MGYTKTTEKVKALQLLKKGYTIKAAAEAISVTPKTLSKWKKEQDKKNTDLEIIVEVLLQRIDVLEKKVNKLINKNGKN